MKYFFTWDVRQAAARALGQHPTPEAVAALCTALRHHTDMYVRQTVAEALGQHDTPEVVAALRTALQDTNADVRRAAAKALGQRSAPNIRRGPAWRGRLAAVRALEQHPTPKAVAALCTALQDTNADVRRAAAKALGQHPTPKAVAALCTALQDTDTYVRKYAAQALGKTQNADAVSPLLTVARRQKQGYIWEALWGLSQRAKVRICKNGQWSPLPPVEPAFQRELS